MDEGLETRRQERECDEGDELRLETAHDANLLKMWASWATKVVSRFDASYLVQEPACGSKTSDETATSRVDDSPWSGLDSPLPLIFVWRLQTHHQDFTAANKVDELGNPMRTLRPQTS